MKIITHGEDTRKKLASGINKLVKIVRPTLGPKAKHVVLSFEFEAPQVLDDGALIARKVEFEDPTENVGAQLARMVSEKTNRIAGDGTTTSLVLADAFTQAMIESDGVFATSAQRRDELDNAEATVEKILEQLKLLAQPIQSNEDIRRVAKISSGTDEIAGIIADAYKELGNSAIVTYQNSKKDGISVSISKGMRVQSGVAPHFLVHGRKTFWGSSKVLVIDGAASKSIVASAMKEIDAVGALTVIADEFPEDLLDTMIMANAKGFQFFPVSSPFYAERRSEILKDISSFCGATVVSKEYVADSLGKVEKLEASSAELVLIEGAGDTKTRVDELKELIDSASAEYDVALLKERMAGLTAGVATINVGMPTEAEQLSVINKIEDAINAVKSALDGGIVQGGGVSLLLASKNATWGSFEPHRGICSAVLAPLHQIQENTGSKKEDWGSDVVDPLKTVVQALTNAWSIAKMVALSESGVVWQKEPLDKSDTL